MNQSAFHPHQKKHNISQHQEHDVSEHSEISHDNNTRLCLENSIYAKGLYSKGSQEKCESNAEDPI